MREQLFQREAVFPRAATGLCLRVIRLGAPPGNVLAFWSSVQQSGSTCQLLSD